MTLDLVDFEPWHLATIVETIADPDFTIYPESMDLMMQAASEHNTKTIMKDGVPLVVGGTMKIWENNHLAWAFFHEEAAGHMVGITKLAKKVLATPKGHVEGQARADFGRAIRWLRVLGFKDETLREEFGPDGSDIVCAYMQNRNGAH